MTTFKAPEGKYTLLGERTYGSLPFSYMRSTRMALARLRLGCDQDGDWLLYNSGDYVYICKHDSTKREVTRALSFAGSLSKPSHPTCLAWTATKDGPDLLVGTFDGAVDLLSLKSQLKQSASSTKPNVAGKVVPEPDNDECRVTAVAWSSSPEATFAVSTSTGSIFVYKRAAVMGESGSKFLGLGSSSKPVAPLAVWSPNGGCVYDVAFSPDGRLLAAACRDGALRLLDATTGATVSGFRSYYGALLCTSFSADGRYVVAGGEDDLVVVYGLHERAAIAHCEGHRSWVSRVAFDSHVQLDVSACTGSGIDGMYRLVSVGQDGQVCLWEVQVGEDADTPAPSGSNMRKTNSTTSLAVGGWQGGPQPDAAAGSLRRGGGMSTGALSASPPRSEMLVYEPLCEQRLHTDPLSDLLVTERMVYTADRGGVVKMWLRPTLPPPADGGQVAMTQC